MAAGPLELWNHQSMQILVLLSFGLQLVLFVFAGVRRREALLVPRLLLWLAYLMADSTAVYAVGHLSFSSVVRKHQLVAFWAPFLLLHLGGPDNITAYAFQDNQLWLRHLQILVVQVLGAAYVLYKNIARGSSGSLLRLASALMFVVGVVKYGERTWALRCSTLESIGASVKTKPPAIHNHFHPQDEATGEEFHLRRAHSLFHICKRAIGDSSVVELDSVEITVHFGRAIQGVELWTLMEIELSLMYDLLYTKAAVVHTFFGYLVRFVSPLTAATSMLLFQFSSKDGHDRADVAITYVLLGGALFMETTSLLNALVSSWTFAFLSATSWSWLRYNALCNERWDRLRRAVVCLHRLVTGGAGDGSRYLKSRRWSYTIGQYNLLHFCTRPADTLFTSPLLGRLARALALDEWWNRKHYSATVEMSAEIKLRIALYMSRLYTRGKFNTGMLRNKWGADPLKRRGLYHKGILKDSLGFEFQEGIIIWHIATEVYLTKSEKAKGVDAAPMVHAIRVMSDYMMFLLVDRPYMLPGQPQKKLYRRTCERLVSMREADPRYRSRARIKDLFCVYDGPNSSTSRVAERDELANNLYDEYRDREYGDVAPRLIHMARLAKELLEKETDGTADSLELVLHVWMDILIYASHKCSRESHAQKLNSGGELTTIVWLMAEHIYLATAPEIDDVI